MGNAIVEYEGAFYELVHYSNQQNPRDISGPDGSGKPWKISEKQDWTDEDFDFIEGSNIRHYVLN